MSNLLEWLEETLSEKGNKRVPKLVTVVNPGNPSGAYIPLPTLQVHPCLILCVCVGGVRGWCLNVSTCP